MLQFTCRPDQQQPTGWHTLRLSCQDSASGKEQSTAQLSTELGSNLLSFQVEDIEYLFGGPALQPGSNMLGTPVLYPTPNRVQNGQFTFEGRTFRFVPHAGMGFSHGVARLVAWECDTPVIGAESIAATTRLSFVPGQRAYELFPIQHVLDLTYTLRPSAIRFDFAIRNQDTQRLPFGLAIHPYFNVIGPRESVRLQIPARKWMENMQMMPTGRLVDLDKSPTDLRKPARLSNVLHDGVFWGLTPDQPQTIYYDSIGKRVTLTASELFTHMVTYTPNKQPFFCMENQSCSVDAHNLNARGFVQEAHLTILEPGEMLTAWVEITVSNQ